MSRKGYLKSRWSSVLMPVQTPFGTALQFVFGNHSLSSQMSLVQGDKPQLPDHFKEETA
jgi:hypothetical protein